jgi:hypothetical protein
VRLTQAQDQMDFVPGSSEFMARELNHISDFDTCFKVTANKRAASLDHCIVNVFPANPKK